MKPIFSIPRKENGISKGENQDYAVEVSSEFSGISKDQVCVLVAEDRQKRSFSRTIGEGRIIKKSLDEWLGSKLSIQNVLCTGCLAGVYDLCQTERN